MKLKFDECMRILDVSKSNDESRFHLNGILWDNIEKCLVSADGHRLTRIKLSLCDFNVESSEDEVIIGPDFLKKTLKVFDPKEHERFKQEPLIKVSEKNVEFIGVTDSYKMPRCKALIEGKFPNYKRLIPTEGKKAWVKVRAQYLKEISQGIERIKSINIGDRNVNLTLIDEKSPVLINCMGIEHVLMPVHP